MSRPFRRAVRHIGDDALALRPPAGPARRAPGTGTPVTGGLSTHQAQSIVRGLCGIDFVAMDIVEVAPAYDVADNTALAAASIALDYLCVLAKSRPDAAP